jgi:hypothetical protein
MLDRVLQQVRHGAAKQRCFERRMDQHVAIDLDLRAGFVKPNRRPEVVG